MAEVLLIRHGSQLKESDVSDPPLAIMGYAQAELVGRSLAKESPPPEAIIFLAGPSKRALQTANQIGFHTGTSPVVEEKLDELVDQRDLTNEEYEAELVRALRDPFYSPPHGRSADQAATSIFNLVNNLTYPDSDIKIKPDSNVQIRLVTHSALIGAAATSPRLVTRVSTDLIQALEGPHPLRSLTTLVPNGSISRFKIAPDGRLIPKDRLGSRPWQNTPRK